MGRTDCPDLKQIPSEPLVGRATTKASTRAKWRALRSARSSTLKKCLTAPALSERRFINSYGRLHLARQPRQPVRVVFGSLFRSSSWQQSGRSAQVRSALVPFGGLLVSMREAKNSGFTSRWTADLHPDRQAFSSETTRNGDCRQPQHIKWPGVVQHL